MTTSDILELLGRERIAQLAVIEDNRKWAWDARQDNAHNRYMTAGRYFILGAINIDLEDDKALREVMAEAYQRQPA